MIQNKFKTVALCKMLLMLWVCMAAATLTRADEQTPLAVTQHAANELTTRLLADKSIIEKNPKHVEKLVEEVLIPIFDTERMAKLVLAKNWKKATPEQQKAFSEGFQKILVRTYASAFAAFDGQEIVFREPKFNSAGDKAIVRSEIVAAGGPPIVVDYRLRFSNGQWKAYDAVIEGVGLLKSYRSQFTDEIRQKGIDGTISSMPS